MPILEINKTNPLVDQRQSETAMMIRNGVVRHCQKLGLSLLPELILKTGRRVDLIGIDRKGLITIIEIKSSVEDFRVDKKWHEYKEFCDRFYFATSTEVPREVFPEGEGLMIADQYGAEIIREAGELKLAAASRKALMLRFSRAAADRLERVSAYATSEGAGLPDDVSGINGD